MTTNRTITLELVRTNVYTRWPCTVCGGCSEKREVLVEGQDEHGTVRVCETCLEAGDLDYRLRHRVAEIQDQAELVRKLIGRLQVPTFKEWHDAEGLGYPGGLPYREDWYADPEHPERLDLLPAPERQRIEKRASGVTTDEYFGGCPECGQAWHLNVGKNHWAYCPEHKTKWPVGYNLFSSWQHETEADWQRNSETLAFCREVEPIIPAGLSNVVPRPLEQGDQQDDLPF